MDDLGVPADAVSLVVRGHVHHQSVLHENVPSTTIHGVTMSNAQQFGRSCWLTATCINSYGQFLLKRGDLTQIPLKTISSLPNPLSGIHKLLSDRLVIKHAII